VTRTVGRDQLADGTFAFVASTSGGRQLARGSQAASDGDLLDDGGVGDITGFAAFEAVEIGLPLGPHAVGVDQVLLVQVFDIGGVGAELRGLGKLLEKTVHDDVGKIQVVGQAVDPAGYSGERRRVGLRVTLKGQNYSRTLCRAASRRKDCS
jgi:hypothetical protein